MSDRTNLIVRGYKDPNDPSDEFRLRVAHNWGEGAVLDDERRLDAVYIESVHTYGRTTELTFGALSVDDARTLGRALLSIADEIEPTSVTIRLARDPSYSFTGDANFGVPPWRSAADVHYEEILAEREAERLGIDTTV